VAIPAGQASLGAVRGEVPFGWDNEFPGPVVDVDAFRIQRLNVTNGDFLAFVDAGGYHDPQWWSPQDWTWLQAESHTHPSFWERIDERWHWRGMFEYVPLPLAWPVYVSQAEATAYAKWAGRRLPTVTDPFFTTRPEGTGLGLAIAKRFVEQNGGTLVISSTVGRGTTVGIHFPAAPAMAGSA